MVKINLNELRKYKVLIYCDNHTEEDYVCCYINSDCYYICGFIENVYTKNGEIVFCIYGAKCKSEKLKHMEIKVHMKDIEVYENTFTETYNIYKDSIGYEFINIKTSNSFKDNEMYSRSDMEYRLYKNLDFRFLMRRLYELVPHEYLCTIEMAMLNDPYVLNRVTIPEDYEFTIY